VNVFPSRGNSQSTKASQAVIAANGRAAACRIKRFFGLCEQVGVDTDELRQYALQAANPPMP